MDRHFSQAKAGRDRFEQIELRRARTGLSIDRLCRRADISTSTYRLLLKRLARVPNFRTVNKLAAAMSELAGDGP